MYRTKLHWPEICEDAATLVLATKTSSSASYNAQIPYSTQAVTAGGTTTLVDPTTGTFSNLSAFSVLKGKYIELDGAVYKIPSGTSISQYSSSSSYSIRATAQKVTYAEMTLFSGPDQKRAIKSSKITMLSNSATDLTMGSVCSAVLECSLITPNGNLSVDAGSQFVAYKVDDDGKETQVGVFNVETPTKVTDHTYKITAYDNVRLLDRDLSEWFNALDGWPYKAKTLASMVAEQCGLTVSTFTAPSYDDLDVDSYYVYRFSVEEGTTGRQLMSWICEALCNFCVADRDGSLKCTWYGGSKVSIGPTTASDHYYFQGSLSHEDYNAADITGIRILEEAPTTDQVIDGSNEKNYYYIVGNPVILNHPYYTGESYTTNSSGELVMTPYGKWSMGMLFRFTLFATFTPFKASIPEDPAVCVGCPVEVTDAKGNTFKSYLTSITWKGHRMTLECTGNRTRANAAASSTLSNKQLMQYSDKAAAKAAKEEVKNLTYLDTQLSTHQYYSDTDDDETAFESWLDTQLAEMPYLSVRDIAFTCYPAISGATICARLYKHASDGYAAVFGFSYNGSAYIKRLLSGTWKTTVAHSLLE